MLHNHNKPHYLVSHTEHFAFSDNLPSQFLDNSSDNSFQIKLLKIEYKKHEEVIYIKDQ